MSKKCNACKKNILGEFLKIKASVFHPNCFLCAYCNQTIKSEFKLKNSRPYHDLCYNKKFKLICNHCNNFLSNSWRTYQNKKYHEECFNAIFDLNCEICNKKVESSYISKNNLIYHDYCYKFNVLEKCYSCDLPIEGKYLIDIWGNKAHLNHSGYKTELCSSCSRIISQKTSNGGLQYNDGRNVCGICKITEITTDEQINHSKKLVIDQLILVGFDYIPNYINVSLSGQDHLNKRLGVKQNSNSHGYTKTVKRKNAQGMVYTEHSIFILYGLPRIKFNAVLAHELLHVWLNEREIKRSPKDIEGFCNLGCSLVYQNDNTEFSQVLLKRLYDDPNTIYGDGFRKMSKKLKVQGWNNLISEMLNSNNSILNKFNSFFS